MVPFLGDYAMTKYFFMPKIWTVCFGAFLKTDRISHCQRFGDTEVISKKLFRMQYFLSSAMLLDIFYDPLKYWIPCCEAPDVADKLNEVLLRVSSWKCLLQAFYLTLPLYSARRNARGRECKLYNLGTLKKRTYLKSEFLALFYGAPAHPRIGNCNTQALCVLPMLGWAGAMVLVLTARGRSALHVYVVFV